jgi:hypothetical protein
MSKLQQRYPGARPFETEQQFIFKGRHSDTERLLRLISLENLVVMYGKSGTGKSSLLNAGIIPRIKAEGAYLPVRVRFNAWQEGGINLSPAETARRSVRGGAAPKRTFLDQLIPDEASLWHDVKEHFILNDGKKGLLLVIDQFEELFTYPPEQLREFGEQLAEALFKTVPQRYWDLLEAAYAKGERPLDAPQLALFQSKPALKVVAGIRSDRLHLLHRIEEYLPVILKNLFELDALDRDAARLAITEPAAMPRMDWFDSEPFLYDEAALNKILDFLTGLDKTDGGKPDDAFPSPPGTAGQALQKIEATQLQIICSELERRVGEARSPLVLPDMVGDLDAIIEQYYANQIARLEPAEQLPARRFIEEGLVFEEEERRLSLYEGQIFKNFKISPATLRQLVDAHLLRAEPSLNGGYTYELSHDTLVAPVLKAKAKRLEEERRIEAERRAKEQEAELAAARAEALREKRRRQRAAALAWGAGLAALLAMVVGWWALGQRDEARKQTEIAKAALEKMEAANRERLRIEVKKYLDAADRMKKRGDLDMAKKILEAALQLDSSNQEARRLLMELQ